jgi:hypothetical protein
MVRERAIFEDAICWGDSNLWRLAEGGDARTHMRSSYAAFGTSPSSCRSSWFSDFLRLSRVQEKRSREISKGSYTNCATLHRLC